MNWVRRAVAVLAVTPILGLVIPSCVAQSTRATQAEVEAAYVYNFGKFVGWPAQSEGATAAEFHICVLGKDPFGEVLDSTVAGESINSRKVTVERISGVRNATSCEVVFVSDTEEGRLKADLSALKAMRVLTVSDIPHFAERGGMIGLVEDGGKIRFEVNLASAQGAGLMLRSDLLKVALKVIVKPAPGGDR